MTRSPGIETVICNEEKWYFRLGARLGVYRDDLTHSTIHTSVLAVPRKELAFWQARLEELKAGTLADGPARALFVHEAVHARQMHGKRFWWWALKYCLSRRFRRRMEEEAYTEHFVYLARIGVPVVKPYWIAHLQKIYAGAFDETRAREAVERMAARVEAEVPGAAVVETTDDPRGFEADLPWNDL